MEEDTLYIEQFLKGDERGFDMLVRRYQDKVLNIARSLIGRDADSEDIAQEAFLKVYHNLRFFRRNSRFSTWLYRIVANTVYSFMRTRRRFVSDEDAIKNSAAICNGPRDVLIKEEREAMLHKAMEKVPVKFRTAMVFKDIEGLSYAEIAKILNCSIGTVESRIYRARQFLKEGLLELGVEAV